MFVGVDGCPEGWLAVVYSESGFETARVYASITDIWNAHRSAERIAMTQTSHVHATPQPVKN